MAAGNSHCCKAARRGIPFGIIAGQPCFNDPWLATHSVPWNSVERVDAVLDVENGSHGNRANAFIAQISE